MAPSERLRSLRKSTPGCRSLAYVDLSARLVLCSDADLPQTQEILDALCLRAIRLLTGPGAAAAAAILGTGAPVEAVTLRNGTIEAFLSSPGIEGEALCAVFSPDCDIETALSMLTEALPGIVPDHSPATGTDPGA